MNRFFKTLFTISFQVAAIIFLVQFSHGENLPLTIHDKLKELEHHQNFELLLKRLHPRQTQEGAAKNLNVPQNSFSYRPNLNQVQNLNVAQNSLPYGSNLNQVQNLNGAQTVPQANLAAPPRQINNVPHFAQGVQNTVQQQAQGIPNQLIPFNPNSLPGLNKGKLPFHYNTIAVPHPVPVPVHIKVPVTVEKPYAVHLTKTVAVPVEKPVYIRVPQPVQVPVAQPYPVPVPHPVQVSVPHPVYIRVLPNGQQFILNNHLGI